MPTKNLKYFKKTLNALPFVSTFFIPFWKENKKESNNNHKNKQKNKHKNPTARKPISHSDNCFDIQAFRFIPLSFLTSP